MMVFCGVGMAAGFSELTMLLCFFYCECPALNPWLKSIKGNTYARSHDEILGFHFLTI
jgi:hypothetical protein